MTELRIHLFGPFEVYRGEHLLTNQDWQSQQTRAVAKILIARQGQVVTSDQVIDILWPEDDPENARRRLHVRISQLRRALGNGKSLVQTVDGGYIFILETHTWLDIKAYQKFIAEGRRLVNEGKQPEAIQFFERARDLYRGDFLAEDLYADWTFSEREYYQENFISLLTEISETYAQQGRYRLAIARCQEALNRDPLRETIYVRLMLYHYFAGERAQSQKVFERCQKVLATELGVDPLESTIKIAEQIRAGTLWASADVPRYPPPIYEGRLFEVPYILSETPFVGRDREYAWLVEQWKNPTTRMVLLEGIAGIGKTRLAETFVGYLSANGVQVLSTRITLGEHSPFAPLISALKPLLTLNHLTKLSPARLSALGVLFPEIEGLVSNLPELMELSGKAERERLYDAVVAFVSASISQPAILFIDDAHRLGQVACEILTRLSDTLKVLVSYRPEEISADHPLQTVIRNCKTGLAIMQLDPLQSADLSQLIQQLAQNSLSEVGREIIQQTSGHPLYLVTLLQHMFDEGQLYVDESGGWNLVHQEKPALPSTIREAIEARLLGLDRSQRRIFDLAAVLGGEFDFELLQTASQQTEENLLSILDRLIDLAMVVEPRRSGQRDFMVAHDRYTEVAYDLLPKVRRKRFHLQAAQAIEKCYADTLGSYFISLAEHYKKAEATDKECHYATLAGVQAAAQFENLTAIHYLTRALELTEPDEVERRFRSLLAREKIFDLLGDRQKQKSDLDDLAGFSDYLNNAQQAEIIWRTAAYEWVTGEVKTASDLLDKAIVQAHTSGAVEIETASQLLKSRCVTHDLARSHQYLRSALALAEEYGLRVIQGDIVRNIGNIYFWENNYTLSQVNFEEALVIHREVGDLRGELSALNNLGHLSQLTGNPKNGQEFFQQGLEICQKIGDRLAEGVLLTNLGNLLVQFGEYDSAETHLKQAYEIREAVNNEEGVGSLLPTLGDVLRRQGKYSNAKVLLERSLEINQRIDHAPQQCLSLDGLSQFYGEMGDYVTAMNYFEQSLVVLKDEFSPNRVKALANGCLLFHQLGEYTKAVEIGESVLSLSQEFPQVRAIALKNLGHALSGLGKYYEAQEKYQQALILHKELMQPHLTPEPLAGLALAAMAQGSVDQAFSFVKQILTHLEETPLNGPDQPIWIYLVCYRVLQTHQNPRAGDILSSAYNLLQARAASIEDEVLRESYLRNVKSNREIIHLFETRN